MSTTLHTTPAVRLIALLIATAFPLAASAASFNLTGNSTSAQTLGSGSGQTGAVAADKSLTVSGSTVAVTISGNNATLSNLGTIKQTGTGRLIRDNTGVSNLVINNGSATNSNALMQAADADVIQMAKSPASVTLNNYGSLISLNASASGSQAVDFSSIASGTNVVNNYAGGLLKASEADAVRPGVNGTVNNWGMIRSVTTNGSSSDGVDAQNNSGVVILNDAGALIDGGRHGITGGQVDAASSFTMNITNNAGATINGSNGSGINIDGLNARQTITLVNHGSIFGTGVGGDGDGVDVDGLVNITNTGLIRSVNAFSPAGSGLAYSEGISVGGGSIRNSGTIEGLVSAGNTNAVGRGITLAGNDISSGPLAGTREALYGNATITNLSGGLIRGQSDSAIFTVGAASGYTITIINDGGATIRGGGSLSAAIKTGPDNTVITNGGLIDGSSSGKAIEMGSGVNTLTIVGGGAVIKGGINGGSGTANKMIINPGAGNTFSYADSISNFSSVEVVSGTVTFSGLNTYSGTTLLSGGQLVLDGANRIAAGSALQLNGGTLALAHAGAADGQHFAGLSLTDSSSIMLGGSSLTFDGLGAVVAGKTLTFTEYVAATSGGYAFRLQGDYSSNSNFLSLLGATTINGKAAMLHFDGAYTDVTMAASVPEPGTYAMLLAGLGLLGVARRRKQQ